MTAGQNEREAREAWAAMSAEAKARWISAGMAPEKVWPSFEAASALVVASATEGSASIFALVERQAAALK